MSKQSLQTRITLQPIRVTFVPILPPYCETLPTCPDGSGDLWWDDASYIRYQTWDGGYSEPERFQYETDSPNYCNGPAGPAPDPWDPRPTVTEGAPF